MIPFLINGCGIKKVVTVQVSPTLLEPCKIPSRLRYSNKGLRQYAIDLRTSLLQCNADKEAIRKELGQ